MTSVRKTDELKLTVRPMRSEDLAEVLLIENVVFSDPWPESAFKDQFTEMGWFSLVAELDSRIIGYACYMVVAQEAHLTNIAVDPNYQRKSVAHELLKPIFRDVTEKKCEYLLLEVRQSNAEARAFYQKHGFRFLYKRLRYYQSPVEDADVLIHYLDDQED